MKTDEIVKLTREAIAEVLSQQTTLPMPYEGKEQRRASRWPFHGTVELSPAGGNGSVHWLGTLHNVSESGLGMSCDHYLKPDSLLDVSFHLPQASLYGRGVVRYCQEVRQQYMVGMEFIFDG